MSPGRGRVQRRPTTALAGVDLGVGGDQDPDQLGMLGRRRFPIELLGMGAVGVMSVLGALAVA